MMDCLVAHDEARVSQKFANRRGKSLPSRTLRGSVECGKDISGTRFIRFPNNEEKSDRFQSQLWFEIGSLRVMLRGKTAANRTRRRIG